MTDSQFTKASSPLSDSWPYSNLYSDWKEKIQWVLTMISGSDTDFFLWGTVKVKVLEEAYEDNWLQEYSKEMFWLAFDSGLIMTILTCIWQWFGNDYLDWCFLWFSSHINPFRHTYSYIPLVSHFLLKASCVSICYFSYDHLSSVQGVNPSCHLLYSLYYSPRQHFVHTTPRAGLNVLLYSIKSITVFAAIQTKNGYIILC